MVQVVDALVVTLGLDASQYNAEQKKAAASLDKTREHAAGTAKEMQARGNQAAEFFSKIRNEALSLAAVLIGGRGLEAVTRDTVKTLADLGRAAQDIGLPVPKVAALRNMIEASGGSAAAATQSFTNLALALQRAQSGLGITGELQTFMSRIGASASDPIDVIYSKFNAWAQGRSGADVRVLGEMGGLDIGTIHEAMKPVAEFQKDMAEAIKRGLPTLEMTKNMRDLESAFTKTTQAVQHLVDDGLNKLAPALTAIFDAITDFIIKHPDVASGIGIGTTVAGGAGIWALLRRAFGSGGAGAGGAGGGLLSMLMRALGPTALLGFIGPAGGEDPEFSRRKNDEYRRNHPSGPDTTGRAKIAYDYFRSQGWTPAQAAALVGGIKGESGFDHTARGDNGLAVGNGQWHPDRVQKILAGTGIDVRTASYEDQLKAMHWELNNTERAAGDKLRASTNVFDASRILVADYERTKNPGLDTLLRGTYSYGYLGEFNTPTPDAVSSLDWVRNLHVFHGGNSSSTSAETHIGEINIHTQATDARGIAGSIGERIRDDGAFVAQANGGIN